MSTPANLTDLSPVATLPVRGLCHRSRDRQPESRVVDHIQREDVSDRVLCDGLSLQKSSAGILGQPACPPRLVRGAGVGVWNRCTAQEELLALGARCGAPGIEERRGSRFPDPRRRRARCGPVQATGPTPPQGVALVRPPQTTRSDHSGPPYSMWKVVSCAS